MVSFSDMMLFATLIVSVISLVYEICNNHRDKK